MLEPATVALLYTPSHCLQAHKLDEKVPIDANQCTSSSADSLHSVVAARSYLSSICRARSQCRAQSGMGETERPRSLRLASPSVGIDRRGESRRERCRQPQGPGQARCRRACSMIEASHVCRSHRQSDSNSAWQATPWQECSVERRVTMASGWKWQGVLCFLVLVDFNGEGSAWIPTK